MAGAYYLAVTGLSETSVELTAHEVFVSHQRTGRLALPRL